jgi:hypothetical protein
MPIGFEEFIIIITSIELSLGAAVLTPVQSKQIRINIQTKQHKNTVQTIQNTVNTSTHTGMLISP